MHFPHFLSVKKMRDERILAQARELALLRLEQCIADLRISDASKRNASRPSAHSAAAKTMLPASWESSNSERRYAPVFNSCSVATATEKIINSLRASAGRLMRVTFSDGVVQSVIIDAVDNAGFLHRGAERADQQVFWTRFEDVNALEAGN